MDNKASYLDLETNQPIEWLTHPLPSSPLRSYQTENNVALSALNHKEGDERTPKAIRSRPTSFLSSNCTSPALIDWPDLFHATHCCGQRMATMKPNCAPDNMRFHTKPLHCQHPRKVDTNRQGNLSSMKTRTHRIGYAVKRNPTLSKGRTRHANISTQQRDIFKNASLPGKSGKNTM